MPTARPRYFRFHRGFFGPPNPGGLLTIVNCLLWAYIAESLGGGSGFIGHDPLIALVTIIISLPLGCFCILLNMNISYPNDEAGIVVMSLGIGLNSILWGYALWGLWLHWTVGRTTRADRRQERGLCPTCGYDLRASTGRCPECGLKPN